MSITKIRNDEAVIRRVPVADLEPPNRIRVRSSAPKQGSDVVGDYAEAYECGLITEPLDVFQEPGTDRYLVADGEHRLLALQRLAAKERFRAIDCRVHEGDEVAALDFALDCNHAHGVQRTKEDRFHAYCLIRDTPELSDKYRTHSEVAEKLCVSVSSIEKYAARWRGLPGGNRKAKKAAKQRAARHSGTRNVTGSGDYLSNQRSGQSDSGSLPNPAHAPETARPSGNLSSQQSAKTQDADAMNLSDLRTAIDLLAQFPLTADEAGEKFGSGLDVAQVDAAVIFINDLRETL